MKRIALALALVLLLPAAAWAQAPEPTPVEGQNGAAFVSYGYATGASASLDNLQFDLDLRLPGTTVSVTGHFTDGSTVHAGPKVNHQVGPIDVFGHHLFLATANNAAAAAIGNKTGGGIEVPLPFDAVLRLSVNDHSNGSSGLDEFTIGIGARF